MTIQEPFKLHAAIFNSLRTLDGLGASKELVLSLEGTYSRNLQNVQKKVSSRYVGNAIVSMTELIKVRWACDCVKDAATVRQVLDEIYNSDGVPDVILQKITFALPYTYYDNYLLKNSGSWLEWTFYPYTFRKTVWERLKATEFPGQKLYIRYNLLRKELIKTLDKETSKRWRDTLMMNKPYPQLTNDEIRAVWGIRHWALILKETRGSFELMNMSEVH